jgi:hypothetical protein
MKDYCINQITKPEYMKTIIFLLLLFVSVSLHAQKKDKSVHLFANTLFGENTKNGIGLGLKYLSGSNGKDFFSLSASFNLFPLKPVADADGGNKRTLPLLAGYHRRFGHFYAEPQIGYGIYGARILIPEFALPSQGAFFAGIETGFVFKKLSIQVKYQSAYTNKNSYLGSSFYCVAAGIAYSLSSHRPQKK